MNPLPSPMRRILVIKLGALGDFVQALGPFQAICTAHPDAQITLLTTKPFAELAKRSGYFDRIEIDERPRRPAGYWRLRRRLLDGQFDFIFDLQTSDRSGHYWKLMWPHRPPMSGIAAGCSHPHANPKRDDMHTVERQREQLAMAGIADVPPPDTDWMEADLTRFALPDGFALLVPGGAAHRPDKRWPVAQFSAFAAALKDELNLTPVLLGAGADREATTAIAEAASACIDLTGQTSIMEIASLARAATLAIGNDTGPMHLAAAAGCRSVVLYSHASNPALCAQRGPAVEILRVEQLESLTVSQALEASRSLTNHPSVPE